MARHTIVRHPIRSVSPVSRARMTAPRARLLKTALAVGVLLVVLAGLLSWGRASTDPAVPPVARLVSDCSGAIRDWVLCVPDRDAAAFVRTQASLIAQADPHIRFHLFYAVDERRADLLHALSRLGYKDAGRLQWHKSPKAVWPWPRDLFLAASTPDGSPVVFLNEPNFYGRSRSPWDHAAMGTFARALGGISVTTGAQIEGGAIVVDDARVIASSAYLEKDVRAGRGRNMADVAARMSERWGLPVVALPVGGVHPSHHCDFVMMPAGDRRMVLASPVLGAALLASVEAKERLRFQAAFRSVSRGASTRDQAAGRQELDIVAAMLERNTRPDVRRAYLRLRAKIEDLGYTCVEVPLLSLDPADFGVGMTLSYANVVLDERAGERVVYLPTYRLPALDHAAAEVWRKLGFRVVTVEALGAGWNGGGLHCLSQLFRTPGAKASQ